VRGAKILKGFAFSASILFAVIAVAAVWLVVELDRRYSRPYATFVTQSGAIGDLRIGESKGEILARLPHQSFAINPKPPECPINWIRVSELPDVYRGCLLQVDEWWEGYTSTDSLCVEGGNVNVKLMFDEDRLISITTECWHSE